VLPRRRRRGPCTRRCSRDSMTAFDKALTHVGARKTDAAATRVTEGPPEAPHPEPAGGAASEAARRCRTFGRAVRKNALEAVAPCLIGLGQPEGPPPMDVKGPRPRAGSMFPLSRAALEQYEGRSCFDKNPQWGEVVRPARHQHPRMRRSKPRPNQAGVNFYPPRLPGSRLRLTATAEPCAAGQSSCTTNYKLPLRGPRRRALGVGTGSFSFPP